MTWMLIRLVLSLAFVGLVLWFAARVAKKRGLGGGGAHGLIEVVARQRMGRSSSVNVVRIGDVVLVVGATEEQITLLAEVDNETIDAALGEQGRPARPQGRPAAPAPVAPAPRRYAEPAREERGYEQPAAQPYDGERYVQEGYVQEGYAEESYPEQGYAEPSYAEHGYADQGYTEQGYTEQGHAEPEPAPRRSGGQHADHRYGGVHRPQAAPTAAGGPLAGSVFDKNGWGTFVNELRERTVRRP